MNAFLTSQAAHLASIPTIAVDCAQAGFVISSSPSSQLVYSESNMDDVEAALAASFGAGSVRRMSGDLILYGDGPTYAVQRLPGAGGEPSIDFAQLVSREGSARPIVFFRPGHKKWYSPLTGWVEAVRAFGYDLRIVGNHEEFRSALGALSPDIVCISAYEYQIQHLGQAYRDLVETRPGAVTLLGGYAAVPAASRFFDIVVPGEADFVLPALLRILQSAVAGGRIDTGVGADGNRLPPHLTAGISDEVRGLTLRRLTPPTDGGAMGEVAVNAGTHLYVMGRDDNPGLIHPFAGPRASWPIPVSDAELWSMWRMPPADEISRSNAVIYSQRGCGIGPRRRCRFCSITIPPGRRMAVDDLIGMLIGLRERGVRTLMFSDEDFAAERGWLGGLLDRIESEGLHRDVDIFMQMRADGWSESAVRRMWDLGVHVNVGLETMNPIRAERMGKARRGKGEAYVGRAMELMELAADHAHEKGVHVGDLLRSFMISMGYGDTIDDVLTDVFEQLTFMKSLKERGRGIPIFSYNLAQIIMSRTLDFLESDAVGMIDGTRLPVDVEYLNADLSADVVMGDFDGIFHTFYVDGDGETIGMMQPLGIRMSGPLAGLHRRMHEKFFGSRNPAYYPKPGARLHLGALVSSLEDMADELAAHYGSLATAEAVIDGAGELYRAVYGEVADDGRL